MSEFKSISDDSQYVMKGNTQYRSISFDGTNEYIIDKDYGIGICKDWDKTVPPFCTEFQFLR